MASGVSITIGWTWLSITCILWSPSLNHSVTDTPSVNTVDNKVFVSRLSIHTKTCFLIYPKELLLFSPFQNKILPASSNTIQGVLPSIVLRVGVKQLLASSLSTSFFFFFGMNGSFMAHGLTCEVWWTERKWLLQIIGSCFHHLKEIRLFVLGRPEICINITTLKEVCWPVVPPCSYRGRSFAGISVNIVLCYSVSLSTYSFDKTHLGACATWPCDCYVM